ncbi:MAG: OmpA family protein [Verrucomicrobiaceae bacterium]|nr:OmpA family protein [Verrucomicrobiaceae bacterium]
MRSTIVLISLALLPVFIYWLRIDYAQNGMPALLSRAKRELEAAGLEQVDVQLNYLDARLSGFLQHPDSRDRAEKIVERLPGVRIPPGNNLITVAAALAYSIKDGQLILKGWLPNLDSQRAIEHMTQLFRPELKLESSAVRLSPYVELGRPVEMPEGPVPSCFQKVLEDLRVPASLSIKRDGDRYILKGMLRSEETRKAVISAAAMSGWELDSSGLRWNSHCGQAPFAAGNGLPRFVEALFSSPTPGEFEIDVRNGPRVSGYVTPGTEAVWLSLLRAVSGEAKVELDVTRVPSSFHFPDYKPTSTLPEGMAKPLVALLKKQSVYFKEGADTLEPSEAVKLGSLFAAVVAAGPEARFIIAGYGDEAMERGSSGRLRVRRVENVRNQLVRMGVPKDVLETSVFDAVRPPGPLSEDVRLGARKVELLLK